jgi:hypothetical protein
MKSATFARTFWLAGLPVAASAILLLHATWVGPYARLPARVDPPVWGKSYVAIYDFTESPSNVDYYLFTKGLFGFHHRMAAADLVFFGSSHVLFGLSAAELSQKLSTAQGRPVKVFNAAVVGTSQSLIRRIVQATNLREKQTLFDLFALQPETPDTSGSSLFDLPGFDDVAAYVTVFKSWTDFWHDWLLDRLFPRLRFGAVLGHHRIAARERFLKWTAIRDWNTGDAVCLWTEHGPYFPDSTCYPGRPINNQVHFYSHVPNVGIGVSVPNALLRTQDIRPIYTLLPFDGSNLGAIPPDAQPFIPISSDGLLYWDGSHLCGAGRDVATEKLFEGLEQQRIVIGPAGH